MVLNFLLSDIIYRSAQSFKIWAVNKSIAIRRISALVNVIYLLRRETVSDNLENQEYDALIIGGQVCWIIYQILFLPQ